MLKTLAGFSISSFPDGLRQKDICRNPKSFVTMLCHFFLTLIPLKTFPFKVLQQIESMLGFWGSCFFRLFILGLQVFLCDANVCILFAVYSCKTTLCLILGWGQIAIAIFLIYLLVKSIKYQHLGYETSPNTHFGIPLPSCYVITKQS